MEWKPIVYMLLLLVFDETVGHTDVQATQTGYVGVNFLLQSKLICQK